MHRTRLLVVAVLAVAASGTRCPHALDTIVVDAPLEGAIFEDAGGAVEPAARVGSNFKLPTLAVRLDGVDLLEALGLIVPFNDASGVVSIAGTPVSISEFSFTLGSREIALLASGLPSGGHSFEVEAQRNDDVVVAEAVSFQVTGPMTLEAELLSAAGPRQPEGVGVEGVVFDASLGQPLAAPPVALSAGGELRSGFVPAAEARIQGGTP